LEIAIHQNYGVAAGVLQSGTKRDLMAEIANQSDISNAAIGSGKSPDFRQRAIGGTVIHEYNLPIGQGIDRVDEPAGQRTDILRLVMRRQYDCNLRKPVHRRRYWRKGASA